MWGQLQKGLDFEGTAIRTINVKLRWAKMTLESIFMKYFLIHDHHGLINDIEIIFIDKTDPLDPTTKEEFWRAKLKTLAPNVLNLKG